VPEFTRYRAIAEIEADLRTKMRDK
jgi:hypothetical protein